MAKKLMHYYTIDTATNSIKIKGVVHSINLLLITDVDQNKVIYNFGVETFGYTSRSFDETTEYTTFVLERNLITSGVTNTSKLQIFCEDEHQVVDFHESFYDPVNKLRVSEPENLIDTDFEYGLQSSKWETLQLQNNVPSFYSTTGDTPIPDVLSVTTLANSDVITVTTAEAHRLIVGTPINVEGLTSVTAEGNFLITNVPSVTQFVYKAKATQPLTTTISGSYTSVIPGRFFNGSQLAFDEGTGITTDEQELSKVTINTDYEHGLVPGEELYLIGSLATKEFTLTNLAGNAPDGRPYVDFADTRTVNIVATNSLNETRQVRGQTFLKIGVGNIDLPNSRIIWPNHVLVPGDYVLYSAGNGDAPIGGLNRLDCYGITAIGGVGNTKWIELGATPTSTKITFTSGGTYNVSRGMLSLAYEIRAIAKPGSNYYTAFYTAFQQNTGTSGRDLSNGLSTIVSRRSPNHILVVSRPGISIPTQYMARPYNGTTNPNNVFPLLANASSTHTQWHPLEDVNRFCNNVFTGYSGNGISGTPSGGLSYPTAAGSFSMQYLNNYDYGFNGSINYNANEVFAIFLENDEERDTLYVASHGLESADKVTITTTGALTALNSTQNDVGTTFTTLSLHNQIFSVEKVNDDRIRIRTTASNNNLFIANGTINIQGSRTNPTKDSFYYENHNFTDGEALVIKKVGASSELPSTATGSVVFNPVNNMPQAFAHAKSYTDTWIAANAGKTVSFTTDGFQPFYQPVIGAGKPDVTFRNYNSQFTMNTDSFGTLNYHRTWPSGYVESRQGNTLDVQFDGSGAGRGYYLTMNDFITGTVSNYRLEVLGSPGDVDLNQYNQQYSYFYLPDANSGHYVYFRQPTTVTGTWRNAYTATYMPPYLTNRFGVLRIQSVTWDNNWSGDSETVSLQGGTIAGGWWWSPEYYNEARLVSFGPNNYVIRTNWLFILPPTTGIWTEAEILTFVNQYVQSVATAFTYPTLVNNQTVYATIINQNRFGLKSVNNVNYNFTYHGVPDLNFRTSLANYGALDGIYKVFDVPSEKSYRLQLPFKALGRTIEVDPATECLPPFVQKTNHGLINGTPVIYNNGGFTSLGGLTSGSVYYAILINENVFQVAATKTDAAQGNPITFTVPAPAQGTTPIHTFKATTVNGIIPGSGVVTTVKGSDTITGDNNSLFKRYYKIGDTVILKDTSTTPESLKEYTVAVIPTDSKMVLTSVVPFTSSSSKYFRKTQLYVKPDGSYLHRPFDGGVLIKAGTSPYSLICRQTRKYFRYQSGKGIQTSYAINFNPPVQCETIQSSGTTVTVTTRYPHGLAAGYSIAVYGASDSAYNGNFSVATVPNSRTFTYTALTTPSTSIPNGIVEWRPISYSGSSIRAGMFDFQNGFFFEYDGQKLYCVRRSSTLQLPGTAGVVKGSNIITGTNTNFSGQVTQGDKLVIRGQTYQVTKVNSRTSLTVQPSYRGVSSSGVIITKTVDVKVPQEQWSLDICDGNGPSGFNFDVNKIQMCYMDYSWYGAGKIRFGFKARNGHVVYVHEFTHNNRLTESYFRSGNLPARYEIENGANPTYIPTLFHWGTSVIMDGRFDDDKAYLFTGSSNTLTFTNGQTLLATSVVNSFLSSVQTANRRFDWFVNIPFALTDANKFTVGTKLYSAAVPSLDGREVHSTTYQTIGGTTRFVVRVFIQNSQASPVAGTYPVIPSGTAINIGEPATAVTSSIDLGTAVIPLLSIRLAPSVDSGLPGAVGQREIINRMQLQLNTIGIVLTHDCEVSLILNADLTTNKFTPVNSPSLCQLVRHNIGDEVVGGATLYSFRASGGAADSTGKRASNTTDFALGEVIDLGNSILGGDGVYPNGPDILTIAIKVIDTFGINATNQMAASARISWAESQA